jgi:hypothetical protein
MKLRGIAAAVLLALAMAVAAAHGNKVHVRGTIEKIGADSIVVKTVEGKSVEIKFISSTVFISRTNNEDKPAKAAELAAGDLVVIHATPKDGGLEADEIKFSAPGGAKPGAAAAAKPKS